MTAIFAVANQKGGVGKTATAINLGAGAAMQEYKTLIIDTDPQGNIADSLGLPEGNDLIGFIDQHPTARAIPAREHLSIIRSDKRTAAYKTQLAGRDYREYVLLEALEKLDSSWDMVIIDCAPSVDILHMAALVAADWLLIPTRLDQFSVKGVLEILQTVTLVNKRGGAVKVGGIIPTFYDRTTTETQEQLENLAAAFGPQVWPIIPQDSKIRTANRAGKTLWEYAPTARAIAGIKGIGGGYQSALSRLLDLLK